MNLHKSPKYSWLITIMLLLFWPFHTADIFVISAVPPQVLEEFQITYTGGGLIFTATFFMAVALYPGWGYLFDRYSRKAPISLSGIIWGLTAWLNALSKTLFKAEKFLEPDVKIVLKAASYEQLPKTVGKQRESPHRNPAPQITITEHLA